MMTRALDQREMTAASATSQISQTNASSLTKPNRTSDGGKRLLLAKIKRHVIRIGSRFGLRATDGLAASEALHVGVLVAGGVEGLPEAVPLFGRAAGQDKQGEQPCQR